MYSVLSKICTLYYCSSEEECTDSITDYSGGKKTSFDLHCESQ